MEIAPICWPCSSRALRVQLRGWAEGDGEKMRETSEERAVFADLIPTTSPGRAFPWDCFAIPLLFIQVAGESSEICREHAFCNTSLWILNTGSMSNHTGTHTHVHTYALFIPGPRCDSSFIWSCDIWKGDAPLRRPRPNLGSLFEFQSQVAWRDPSAVKHHYLWVPSSEHSPPGNGGLWLARLFGCGAVSCNNILLARVQARGRLQ